MAANGNSTNWKNVNNWHWVEKNCLPWAKDHITSQLSGLTAADPKDPATKVSISEIADVTGDVHLNQRKGKIITIYDVQIDLRWKGETSDGAKSTGKINIPEFDHDTAPKDIPFETSGEEDPAGSTLRALVKSQLLPLVREKLATFSNDLRGHHAKDVYIAPDEMTGHPVTAQAYQPKPPAPADTTSSSASRSSVKGGVTKITQSIEFVCNAQDLYTTLTDRQRVAIWSRSPRAEMSPVVGSQFSLFDGNIQGSILELVENKKIVQKWRLRSWPSDHYSTVTLVLEEGDDSTTLKLTQTDVPIAEKDTTENNWRNYYWNGIKSAFGFGSLL